MNFYKSVIEHHGKLLVRGIHNGQEFKEKIDYSPTLYAISQENTEFKIRHQFNLRIYGLMINIKLIITNNNVSNQNPLTILVSLLP